MKRKDQVYCAKRCAGKALLKGKKQCVACGVLFLPKRPDQSYCNRVCYEKTVGVSEKRCPACGVSFTPDRPDQKFCGSKCREEGKQFRFEPLEFVSWDTWEADYPPYKRHWRNVPEDQWTITQFWFWFCDAMADNGYEARRVMERADWCKLRVFQEKYDQGDGARGVPLAELKATCHALARDFSVYQVRFGWNLPFAPGSLIGYWESIVAMQHGRDRGMLQKWNEGEGGNSWDTITLERGAPVDFSWESIPSRKASEEEKPVGRIKVVDWKNLPPEKWTVTTLWTCVYDELRDKGVRVQKLNTSGRARLKDLVAREGMESVRLLILEFLNDYYTLSSTMTWDGPFKATIMVGFWGGIRKRVLDKVPFLLENFE